MFCSINYCLFCLCLLCLNIMHLILILRHNYFISAGNIDVLSNEISRPCGLVFAHAWGLKDHQIRGCPVDEPLAKRCKREDDGVEDTYDYELECYLKDLPATVCCVDQLPTRVEPSPEFRRQHGLLRSRRDTLGGISISKRRTRQIFRFVRTSTGNVSPSLPKRADHQRTAIQVHHSSSSTRGRRHLWTLLCSLRQIQI